MRLKGKQRLVLLVVVAAVLVGGLSILRGALTNRVQEASETAGATNVGGASATATEVAHLKSWGLSASELPTGVRLQVAEEFRNYAAAAGDKDREKEYADKGRIDGYYQQWLHDGLHLQIADKIDLYKSPATASAVIAPPVASDAVFDIQDLPDPKLGNLSRMYSFTTTEQASQTQRLQGWVVQWTRGRTLFEVNGVGPPGQLQGNDILHAARLIDGRAAKSPIN